MSAELAAEISRLFIILHRWGIHSLGDLAALDRDALGARLGPLALQLWDQASGRSTRLLRLVRPAEIFREALEFEHEVETAEPLLFVLRRLLEQLSLRLASHYLVASELTLQLHFADKTAYTHRFQIPEPTSDLDVLFRLLQTHLENFRTEHPIVAVALEMQPARPGQQQFDLFATPLRDPTRLHETLNRLTGLLGKERVGTPVREDSHRPEAFHLEAFSWEELPNESPNESREELPNDNIGFGPARRRLHLARQFSPNGATIARQGPYRSSGDWWDGKQWARTEWDVQFADGSVARCQERGGSGQPESLYD